MITSVNSFIKYFGGVRQRTIRYIKTIPVDQVEWAPNENEFSCGDLVRHITSAERMFVGVVVDGRWNYAGHEHGTQQDSLDTLITQLEATHEEMMQLLSTVNDEEFVVVRHMVKAI